MNIDNVEDKKVVEIEVIQEEEELLEELPEELQKDIEEIENEMELGTEKDGRHRRPCKMTLECGLSANVNNKNEMIYLCPKRPQYFAANIIKCCNNDKDVTLTYKGRCYYGWIYGKLAWYKIVSSGIIAYPHKWIYKKQYYVDKLKFEVDDGCNKVDIVVPFAYSPCINCGCGVKKDC